MKSLNRSILAVAFFATFLGLVSHLSAQSITAGATDVIPVEAQNLILGWLLKLAQVHPFVATLFTIVGLARVWVKPVFSIVHWLIDLTPSGSDNAVFDRLVAWFHTPVGSKIAYLLDWAFSIKIIPPAKPAPVA